MLHIDSQNQTYRRTSTLVVSVLISTLLVDKSQDVIKWAACWIQGSCSDILQRDAKLAGLALGAALSFMFAAAAAHRGDKDRGDLITVVLGILFGGLIAILKAVETDGLPNLTEIQTALFVYLVIFIVVLAPLLADRNAANPGWLAHYYWRIGYALLLGAVCGGLYHAALVWKGPFADWKIRDFGVGPYAVVAMPSIFGTALAAMHTLPATQRMPAATILVWSVLLTVLAAALAFGYGAFVLVSKGGVARVQGVGAAHWGALTFVLMFAPVILSAVTQALIYHKRRAPIFLAWAVAVGIVIAGLNALGGPDAPWNQGTNSATEPGFNYLASAHVFAYAVVVGIGLTIAPVASLATARIAHWRDHRNTPKDPGAT